MEIKKYLTLAAFIGAIATGAYLVGPHHTNEAISTTPRNTEVTQTSPNPGTKLQGSVLPFKIWGAFRNLGLVGAPIDISVAVTEGGRGDWAATAVYLTNLAIKNGAPSATAEVFQENPWGDRPPQEYKLLAKVYYDPTESEKGKAPWAIFLSDKMAPMQDIEFDELAGEISSGQNPEKDPEQQMERNDKQAKAVIIKKYRLPKGWEPDPAFEYTTGGEPYTEKDVSITPSNAQEDAAKKIDDCLLSDEGTEIYKGCYAPSDEFPFILPKTKRSPPIDYNAPNILRSNIDPGNKCLFLNKYLKTPHHPTADEKVGNSMFWAMLFQDAKIPPQNDEIYNELIIATAAKCLADPNISIIIAAKAARYGMSASPSGE